MKKILLIGGGSGIGSAIANLLISCGNHVTAITSNELDLTDITQIDIIKLTSHG